MILIPNAGLKTTQALPHKMNQTRVLLSVEHQLYAHLLKNSLASRSDVELVGETKGIVDTLMLIASKKPDLWIHSWADGPSSSAALSHACSIHPSLAVMRINPSDPAGQLQLPISSVSQLMDIANRTRPLLNQTGLEIAGNVT